MFTLYGNAASDEFGSCVAGIGDVNLDLRLDLAVGARLYDGTAGENSGRVQLFSTCAGPVTYCPSGTSASGCNALLSAVGVPSATNSASFVITASSVEGRKNGMFFFGTSGRQALPWGFGSTSFLCVKAPVKRAGVMFGVGTPGYCNGSFSQDLNELWAADPTKNPGAGAVVQAQLWYRDPQNPSGRTTSLSNAIEFVVCD